MTLLSTLRGPADLKHLRRDQLPELAHEIEESSGAKRSELELAFGILLDVKTTVESAAGEVRGDVPAKELATFCLAAMSGARGLGSEAAVVRLVALTLDALRAGSSTG